MRLQHSDLAIAFELKSGDASVPDGFIKGIATTPKKDTWDDIIAVGAFSDSIRDRGVTGPRAVKMLAQHDSRHVIGNWTKLEYSGEALHVEGLLDLANVKGAEYYNHIKKDQVGSLSVGFTTLTRQYDEDSGVRTIIKGDLREISPVTFPANEDAVITHVKSADGKDEPLRQSAIEKKIGQEFGLSRKQSSGLIQVIRSSGLLASAPVVPETTGVTIATKEDESNELVLKTIRDMEERALLAHIQNVTARIRC